LFVEVRKDLEGGQSKVLGLRVRGLAEIGGEGWRMKTVALQTSPI
jgi:hypothetical protein